ncbi:hypothetical protein Hanom_Chr10g00885681 [Helianthus anomalus]
MVIKRLPNSPLVLPFLFLLIATIILFVFCKLQKVNLLMVGEYTELLVLNCYIYKLRMILKLLISHRNNLYLKYRSSTNIRYFTALTA